MDTRIRSLTEWYETDFFNKMITSLLAVSIVFSLYNFLFGILNRGWISLSITLIILIVALIRRMFSKSLSQLLFSILLVLLLVTYEWFSPSLIDYCWMLLFPLTFHALLGKKRGQLLSLLTGVILLVEILWKGVLLSGTVEVPQALTLFAVYGMILIIQRRYDAMKDELFDLVMSKNRELEQEKAVRMETQRENRQLSELLPVCSSCKRIADEEGNWIDVDQYLAVHTETSVSHSLCPECVRKLYPEIAEDILSDS